MATPRKAPATRKAKDSDGPEVRYANCSCALVVNGVQLRLTKGDAWYADDPVVQTRPELFDARPTMVRGVIER